jgi:hypothetical protein
MIVLPMDIGSETGDDPRLEMGADRVDSGSFGCGIGDSCGTRRLGQPDAASGKKRLETFRISG